MRNEKLEMRKWKRKWKWSSLLLVDNTEVDAIVYLWCIKRSVVKVLFVKIIDTIIDLLSYYEIGVLMHVYPPFSHIRNNSGWIP